MLNVARDGSSRSVAAARSGAGRRAWRGVRWGLGALSLAAALASACSDDDPSGGQCVGGDGAVAGEAANHCIDESGMQRREPIGACVTSPPVGDAPIDVEEEEEDHPILTGREADDDNCKYHVRFENTCVAVNQPVTFTLSLTRLIDSAPGTGTVPSNPEIFMENDRGHISPSNDITATEGPAGTYEIGPVVFDAPGRWVVRFHYFDNCSELQADSPHSHVAFYIDVP
jgi:hypothetical protein